MAGFNIDELEDSDDQISEELPEQSEGAGKFFVAKVLDLGFKKTPAWKGESFRRRGEVPPERMFVSVVDPLDFAYDTDPASYIYEQQGNYSVQVVKYRNKNGSEIQKNSPFGDLKAAYTELGYPIRDNEDCKKIIGKTFQFQLKPKLYVQPKNEKENTEEWRRKNSTWIEIPVREVENYSPPVPRPVEKRPKGGMTSAVDRIDPLAEAADSAKLIDALVGVPRKEWLSTLVVAGVGSPYMDWAAADNGQKLLDHMTRMGLTWNGEVLVK